jgi:conjugative transfer signal peptidase TraF
MMLRASVIAVSGLAIVAVCISPRAIPSLVWNATPSAPVGLYAVMPERRYARGELVLVHTPESVRMLAAERHYIPATVPLVKRIAATAGDEICASNMGISINGSIVATRLGTDSRGRALPVWSGCRMLGKDDVFLLMKDVRDSFDGRYFGAVSVSSIIGRVSPLWIH